MNKIEINKEIISIINQRKNDAKIMAQQCLDAAYSYPDFAELDKKFRTLNIEIAKKEFENLDVFSLKNELKNIGKQREDMAKKYNIDMDKFSADAHYTCPLCKDTGFIKGEKCKCYKKLFSEINFNQNAFYSNLPSLSDFDRNVFDDAKQGDKLFNLITKYVGDFPDVPKFMQIQGAVGVGKSYMAQIIMSELIKRNHIVNYFTAFEFSKTLKNWHFADLREKEEYENLFLDCDLLIIDDLGTEPIYNNINYEYMQNIFDQRQWLSLPTIIISNLLPEQFIEMYGERLYSRMYLGNSTISYTIINQDIRKKLKNNKNGK